MLSIESQESERFLNEMLSAVTLKIGELLAADRTSVFLLDEDKTELLSIAAKNEGNGSLVNGSLKQP